uniref:Uncharacterized protein n=1 Tax=Oryzias melastigma TaxID=30732 RepID=A0A3B3CGI7_ORYME
MRTLVLTFSMVVEDLGRQQTVPHLKKEMSFTTLQICSLSVKNCFQWPKRHSLRPLSW